MTDNCNHAWEDIGEGVEICFECDTRRVSEVVE